MEKIHIKDLRSGDIDCSRNGPWGNPFVMDKNKPDYLERDRVCDEHMSWLRQGYLRNNIQISQFNNVWVIDNYRELIDKRLACWCGPKRCHVDNLIAMAKGLQDQEQNNENFSSANSR